MKLDDEKDKKSPKKIDLLTIIAGPKKPKMMGNEKESYEDETEDESEVDLALRAAFDALKSDDFESFKEAMIEFKSCL